MQPVSAKFLTEIRRSHRVESYIDVTSPTGRTQRLDVTGGSVDIDRTADIRRRLSCTVVDDTGLVTPKSTSALLTPFGTVLQPYRGVMYADGTTEVVPLGVFRLSKVDVKDSSGGSPQISLEGFDLARTVQRNKFTSVYTVVAGTNIITAIKTLLGLTFPNLSYDSISTALVTTGPTVYDIDADPWKAITDLATSIGCEVFFDATGNVVIAPPTDIDHLPSPDFTYIEGNGCTMLDLDVVYTDEPGFNGVVVTGESVGDELPPVRSIAWDTSPSSPTYYLGPYGQVPMFISDSNVKTQSDADAAAQGLLRGLLGFSSQLSITAYVNPAIDCGDTIDVERARSGVTGRYAIDTISMPLEASGTSSVKLRQKRTFS